MFRVSRILFLVLYAALAAAQDSPAPDAQANQFSLLRQPQCPFVNWPLVSFDRLTRINIGTTTNLG